MPNNVHSNNRISTGRKNQPTDIGRLKRVVIREKKRGQFRTWMARVETSDSGWRSKQEQFAVGR
jgi:hypothetical protein